MGVEPRKFIGANIYMRGVHELPVCEVLWRLAGAGEAVVDVGANIGVMTSLFSRKAGEHGRVFAFEAHPEVFRQLEQNVRRWNRPRIELFHRAVSSQAGMVCLREGAGFAVNEGTARVAEPGLGNRSFEVESVRLDDVLAASSYGVAKIDVEGHELEALSGASDCLAAHRLRDIVFESTWDFPGAAHELLLSDGYRLFEIQSSLLGPRLVTVPRRSGPPGRQADYLATLDWRRAGELLRPRGWQVLRAKSEV